MKQKKLLTLLEIIILIMVLISCTPSSPSSSAMPTPDLYNNDVDLSPIMNLELPEYMGLVVTDVVDIEALKLFPHQRFEYPSPTMPKFITLTYPDFALQIGLEATPDWATDDIKLFCGGYDIYQSNLYLPEEQDKYCISHLRQTNSHPNFLVPSQPTGNYAGVVNLQRGNLVILINQYTQTTDPISLNEAIKQLATVIKPPVTYENQVNLSPLLDLDLPNDMGQIITNTVNWEMLNALNITIPVEKYKSKNELHFTHQIADPSLGNGMFEISFALNNWPYDDPFLHHTWCQRPIFISSFVIENEEFNCISYLVEPNNSKLDNTNKTYGSNVVVYKGNFWISIEEQTTTLDRTLINEVIKQIAAIIIVPSEK